MNLFWLVCLFSQSTFALDTVMITGSWSPWSTRASPCFRSPTEQSVIVLCGVGMTRRYRSCTNPTPQGGGANCSGLAEQWTPCNTQECQLPDGNYTCQFSIFVFYLLTKVDPHPTVFRKKGNCIGRTCLSQKHICRPQSVFFPLIKVSPQFSIKGISSLKPLILRIYVTDGTDNSH